MVRVVFCGEAARTPAPVAALAVAQQPDQLLEEFFNGCIANPFNGELVDKKDVDSLIDTYEKLKVINDQASAVLAEIRHALWALTEGDANTRRVRGRRRKAKLEAPSLKWDQATLKQVWSQFPELAPEWLKIDTIGVKLTEYKKLVNTSGNETITAIRSMLESANRGREGLPSLSIEG